MKQGKGRKPGAGLWQWLDAAPLLWLVLVFSAYALLAMQPLDPRHLRESVRGVGELERWAAPLLAALVLSAILRYFHDPGFGSTPEETASPVLGSEAEAVQTS